MDHLLGSGLARQVAVNDDAVEAVINECQQMTEQAGEEFHGAPGRTRIKRGPGKRIVDGKSFRLADEVRYIQRRAAEHDGRIVSVGQLVLFSTETLDTWLLDPLDHLAARLARDGEPEPIHIEDTDTTFAIEWKGQFNIEGETFVYVEAHSGRVAAISGYPTRKLAQLT